MSEQYIIIVVIEVMTIVMKKRTQHNTDSAKMHDILDRCLTGSIMYRYNI